MEGFQTNTTSQKRGYRIGIDASIWLHHATASKGGENPQLRLLFFKTLKLLHWPILPLVMFDGRLRPKTKRGSRLGKSGSHPLSKDFKVMLGLMGIEWREAAGEAEAELAQLNRANIIDAILTDDVDAFLFGARTLIKNPSANLSGNKLNPPRDKDGKPSKHHVLVYTADAIEGHLAIGLTRGGMILFALLVEAAQGVEKIGKAIAHGLARCGFGDQLLQAFLNRNNRDIQPFLQAWRAEVNEELRTNSKGFLPRGNASAQLPNDFPDLQVLSNYATPVTHVTTGRGSGGALRDPRVFNIAGIAAFCEEKFGEWGYKEIILKRFRTLVWPPAFMHLLRRTALEVDARELSRRLGDAPSSSQTTTGISNMAVRQFLGGTPSADPIAGAFVNQGTQQPQQPAPAAGTMSLKILKTREHITTDHMLEWSVEFSPVQFVDLALSGIKGFRGPAPVNFDGDDELDEMGRVVQTTTAKQPPDPRSPVSMWVPACMVDLVDPAVVEGYLDEPPPERNKGTKGRKTSASQASQALPKKLPRTEVDAGPSSSSRASQGQAAVTATQFEFEGMVLTDVIPPSASGATDQSTPPLSPQEFEFEGQTYRDVDISQVRSQPPARSLQRHPTDLDLTITPPRPSQSSLTRREGSRSLKKDVSIVDLTNSSPIRAPPEREIASSSAKNGPRGNAPLQRDHSGRYSEPLPDADSPSEEAPRSHMDFIFEEAIAPRKEKGKNRERRATQNVPPRQPQTSGPRASLARQAKPAVPSTQPPRCRTPPWVHDIVRYSASQPVESGESRSLASLRRSDTGVSSASRAMGGQAMAAIASSSSARNDTRQYMPLPAAQRDNNGRYSEPEPEPDSPNEEAPRSHFDFMFEDAIAPRKGKGKNRERRGVVQDVPPRQTSGRATQARHVKPTTSSTQRPRCQTPPWIHDMVRYSASQPSARKPRPSHCPGTQFDAGASGTSRGIGGQATAASGSSIGSKRSQPPAPIPCPAKRPRIHAQQEPIQRNVTGPQALPPMGRVPSVFRAEGDKMFDDDDLDFGGPCLPSAQPARRRPRPFPIASGSAPAMRTPSSSQDSRLDDDCIDLTGY
ncbi:hypothetical protein ONZ45_g755 [Pleurotus djamor]|nr:hypothetical protein ONZ45_g755 [Pleurotus djamor]